MAKSVKGTQTEKNLIQSFAGESQARMRYTYFASKAKKEGLEQISAIFTETADNEKEHAERFFKFLEGGTLQVTGSYPAGIINTTVENLRAAAAGENEEYSILYPTFAKVADEEGFPEIAECWRRVSIAEKHHESRYLELLDNLENDKVFKKDTEIRWKCRNCGYVYTSKEAYEKCPACLHPKAYMEELADNY
jgi:rubrerythrin